MCLSEMQKGQDDREKWCSDEVVHGKASSVQGINFITYFSAHCYFSFSTVLCFSFEELFQTALGVYHKSNCCNHE